MYIYFALAVGTDSIKIGMSNNPYKRRKHISNATPYKIIIYKAVKVPEEYFSARIWEAMCHEHFQSDRIKGEWFKLTDRVIDFLEKISNRQPTESFMEYFGLEKPATWLTIEDRYNQ